jgi:hypothetical protein
MMNVDLSLPDHSTLSHRNQRLKTKLERIGKTSGRVDLVIDSTGLVMHEEVRWVITTFNFPEYPTDLVLMVVRSQLRYCLSLRHLIEMMRERGSWYVDED